MIASDITIVSRLYLTYSYNFLKIIQYVWMNKFLNGHRKILNLQTLLVIISAKKASDTTT